MTIIDQTAYKAAFAEYLRRGTPIRLDRKETPMVGHDVWRTQSDEKVRPSHRANDGRIFSWSDPPATGHPGEDHNCRAVPFPICREKPSSPSTPSRKSRRSAPTVGATSTSWRTTMPAPVAR